ncbi:DegT/DnrJ/EryC1/StrS family aminotransferase [Prosthecobacter vanneervenii]|uniref:dTDP-4-amino-4,6-dideoxygalactose transaminase n=1 Tax=Prosthecobacter vanneervenii TaxID=48466 RepID=A0A7W7YC38_9BACT|nr:DegT/DnrJ/EryC1/StrS family aminotransferase [Prosthecobacter vanneervenii]MBB5033282.1 dTDP-4-amino-4,6-dideoxygalactose transaminase [Prosthecobacter vanneervenii]
MPVPLLDVNAQNLPLESELQAAFTQVLHHGRFIMGPEMETFEKEVAEMVGVKHALSVSSGTDALLLALMALDIKAGDEVLCPAFTFFATAGAVSRLGAVPVFTDVCPICFNLDVNDARKKITAKTKAIIPVHLFGQCADMIPILALAKEHGLKVIEDAAQSIGARYRGTSSGTMGDFGTYSFFPSKNLGGFGDGGMLVTNDDGLAEYARVLRVHGGKPKYYHHYVGGNFRMDTLQCALLSVKLKRYAQYTADRQRNAAHYISELTKLPGVVQADPAHCKCVTSQDEWLVAQDAKIVLPVSYAHNEHIWNQFTIRVLGGRRDSLRDHLVSKKIGCDIYYPVTLDQQKCFADLPAASLSGCEVAHRVAGEVLSIPIYGELTEAQRLEVVAAIHEWLA